MAFGTLNDFLAAMATAQRVQLAKGTATTNGAGFYHSLWTLTGEPAAGSAAGSLNGAVCDKDTAGAIRMYNPTAGKAWFVAAAKGVVGTERSILSIFDRVWHDSAIDANTAVDQNITSPAWGRWTDGIGLELWVECYAAWGAGAFNLTIDYTDESSGASQAVHAQPADAPVAGQAFRVPLATGDKGILAISKAKLSAGSGAAGNLGLTVAKRICDIALPASGIVDHDWSDLGLPEVPSGACLFGILHGQAASIPGSALSLMLVEG